MKRFGLVWIAPLAMAAAWAQRPPAADRLTDSEQSATQDPAKRPYLLSRMAVAAFDAGDLSKAERYAWELLSANSDPKDWNHGNAIFFGNMILGRVALKRDHNVAAASASLLAAGRTPGSPQLNSFGPNMSLAGDLIAAGETAVVVQFFDQCRKFWKLGGEKLGDWTALVKGGRTPNFGANLVYD